MRRILLLLCLCAWTAFSQYVRVSPRDARYLEYSDGKPYIPIGLNMIAPPGGAGAKEDEAFAVFESWLKNLSANGGNYIRVWLSNPFWEVEHRRSGEYDAERARRIDRMLELCRRYGIRVKMTMEHFRSILEPATQKWAARPLHHVSQGGPAQSIADFFDGEASRAQFRRKIRWFADRYGDREEIYGWELWNEINAVRGGDYLTWTEIMLQELHRAFPKNLAMQSLGSFDTPRVREIYRKHSLMPGNDLAQVHRYLDLGASLEVCKGPVDILAADAIREILSYQPGKPAILAESGAVEPRHTGPFKLYAADKAGIILHDVLFAPFFAGSAGSGQIWHWDAYVAKNNLWRQFAMFAETVKGLDPPAENFAASVEEQGRLRVYKLKGRKTTLAWCRDMRNNWRAELEQGIPPETLRGLTVKLDGATTVRVFDPWSGKWSTAKARRGQIKLPDFSRSIVVRY